MTKLIAYRVLLAVPQLVVVSIIAFSLTYFIPGSPAAAILGIRATPERIAEVETSLGLDQPAPVRLVQYLGSALQGDFGQSFQFERPVTSLVLERMPATLSMVIGGITVALLLGIAMGIVAGTRIGAPRDRAIMGGTAVAVSVPQFWTALLLLLFVSIQLGWVPVVAYTPFTDNPLLWARGIALPSLALGIPAAGLIARQMRVGMSEALGSTYAASLAAVGLPRRRFITRYGFRNALVPVLAATGLTFGILVGASFAVETVFTIPGVGALMLSGVTAKDYPLVQGGVVLIALFVITLNILLDVSYGIVNPRTRPQ